jgi:hypothetical protein
VIGDVARVFPRADELRPGRVGSAR